MPKSTNCRSYVAIGHYKTTGSNRDRTIYRIDERFSKRVAVKYYDPTARKPWKPFTRYETEVTDHVWYAIHDDEDNEVRCFENVRELNAYFDRSYATPTWDN